MNIEGKIIIVTGAASGIGRAMARRFKAEGAAGIIVADRAEAELGAVADEIGGLAVRTDVSSEDDVKALVERTEAEFGRIDLMCNNAGIGIGGGPEVANDDWQRIWDINVMAHVFAARHALPGMLERGEGYFLNTASAAGLLSQIGSAPYAVTKHAAVGFAEWLAITYGGRGIKVSVLCPQAVRTAMTAGNEDGVASINGMMEPEQLCDTVVEVLRDEQFLVLPHGEVLTYMQRKTGDYDRWIRGMQKLQAQYSS